MNLGFIISQFDKNKKTLPRSQAGQKNQIPTKISLNFDR